MYKQQIILKGKYGTPLADEASHAHFSEVQGSLPVLDQACAACIKQDITAGTCEQISPSLQEINCMTSMHAVTRNALYNKLTQPNMYSEIYLSILHAYNPYRSSGGSAILWECFT